MTPDMWTLAGVLIAFSGLLLTYNLIRYFRDVRESET